MQRALAPRLQPGSTMLCVEDAHLLDEATAERCTCLSRAARDPLIVVLMCRAEWIRTTLPRGVVELSRGDRALDDRARPSPPGAGR